MANVVKAEKIENIISDKSDHHELIDLMDKSLVQYTADGRCISIAIAGNEVIDYVLMGDQYFYNNWITQFAIGNVGGRNYFDMTRWSQITDEFKKGVIVVHEETKDFLFIIPKFIEPQYTETARAAIRNIASMGSHASHMNKERKNKILRALSDQIVNISNKDKKFDPITDLIPPHIYEMFNINPKVLKDVIYIRDTFKTIRPGEDTAKQLTDIITKRYKGEHITQSEKEFVWSLTDNQYIFPNSTPVKKITPQYNNDIFDPFED